MATGHAVDASTLALWRLDDQYGADYSAAIDETGNYPAAQADASRRPSIQGGPNGQGEYARWFRGGGDSHLEFTPDAAMVSDLKSDWTWQGKVYLERLGLEHGFFTIGKPGESEANNYLSHIHVTSADAIYILWEYDSGQNVIIETPPGIMPVRTWVDVAVTVSVSGGVRTTRLYVNGMIFQTGSGPNATGGEASEGTIGIDVDGTNQMHGMMLYARITRGVLSDAQILVDAGRSILETTPDTLVHWRFQERPELLDIGPNGWHGHPSPMGDTPMRQAPALIEDNGIARASDLAGEAFGVYGREEIRLALIAPWSLSLWTRGNATGVVRTLMIWAGAGESESSNFLTRLRIEPSAGQDYEFRHFSEHAAGENDLTAAADGALRDFGSLATNIQARRYVVVTFASLGGGNRVMRVYVDGVIAGTSAPFTGATGGQDPTSVSDYGIQFLALLHGVADDVLWSAGPRSPEDILDSYNEGITPGVFIPPPDDIPIAIVPAGDPIVVAEQGRGYDGDALFLPTENGGDMVWEAGDPHRTGGLGNAIYLSMFSGPYWADALDSDDDDAHRHTGATGRALDSMPITSAAVATVEAFVIDDTAWMITAGLADTITAIARITGPMSVSIAVTVVADGRSDGFEYSATWGQRK